MPPGVNFELIKYECSCPRFQEKAACKHAIMLGLHTSKITLPDVCSQTWFRARKGIRSAGRPRKMTDGRTIDAMAMDEEGPEEANEEGEGIDEEEEPATQAEGPARA